MDKFLNAWKSWAQENVDASGDQCLLADRELLNSMAETHQVMRWGSWRECQHQFDPWDKRTPLHTGLVPLPFVGDVRRAKVYFLLLNPGLSATDYFAEYEVPGFRNRLLANLRQDFKETEYPFFPLDPDCAWHSGNEFWQKKLEPVLLKLHERTKLSHALVRKFLAQSVCAIEMVPYHSVRLAIPMKVLKELPSGDLAREHVNAALVREAQNDNCMLVAMRQVTGWNLPHGCKNVVQFSAGQARGAHLSTKVAEAAGSRVVEFLLPILERWSKAEQQVVRNNG